MYSFCFSSSAISFSSRSNFFIFISPGISFPLSSYVPVISPVSLYHLSTVSLSFNMMRNRVMMALSSVSLNGRAMHPCLCYTLLFTVFDKDLHFRHISVPPPHGSPSFLVSLN
ncbi:hypothetical protein FKM82_022703 [Ascaphus truei]